MEGIYTALKYGADAIYCGGPFLQLRAESAGFDVETLQLAAAAVHSKGQKTLRDSKQLSRKPAK